MNSPIGTRRVPRVLASSISAPDAYSGGSASPAGEEEPRLPPIVPRLRICGEPTVRDAAARPGSAVAQLGDRARVGDAGADAQRAVALLPLGQLAHAREIEDRLGPLAAEVEVDHHVRAAPQRQGARVGGARLERLAPVLGLQELHAPSLRIRRPGLSSVRSGDQRSMLRLIALAVLSMGMFVAAAASAEAKVFRGKTSQGRPAAVIIGSDGLLRTASVNWRARCRDGRLRDKTYFLRPHDASTPDAFADAGTYRRKDGRFRIRFTASISGDPDRRRRRRALARHLPAEGARHARAGATWTPAAPACGSRSVPA